VTRAQREAAEETRRLREEAAEALATARAEADALRHQARQRAEEAREEVAALARRRDTIAEELQQLSGVIEALAVPASAEAVLSEARSGLDATDHDRREEGP
jgi:uncharacterized coiled-coil DUF342 family protein